MRLSYLFVFILFATTMQAESGFEANSFWDKALKENVNDDGIVNYNGFRSNASFAKAIELYESSAPGHKWTREEKMAYWINVYNAFTVQLILDYYPVQSITEIPNAWDKKFINIGDQVYTLNHIEHEILRPTYKDPRIHFAINCASFSCPKLHNKAFRAETLYKDLEMLTKEFVNDPKRNNLDGKNIKVSKLFEWYSEDFTKDQSVIDFVKKYADTPIESNAKLGYMKYNWDLNNR